MGRMTLVRGVSAARAGRKWPVTSTYASWALLGSNQRPLPCKGNSAG